jgi:hypothetical protein
VRRTESSRGNLKPTCPFCPPSLSSSRPHHLSLHLPLRPSPLSCRTSLPSSKPRASLVLVPNSAPPSALNTPHGSDGEQEEERVGKRSGSEALDFRSKVIDADADRPSAAGGPSSIGASGAAGGLKRPNLMSGESSHLKTEQRRLLLILAHQPDTSNLPCLLSHSSFPPFSPILCLPGGSLGTSPSAKRPKTSPAASPRPKPGSAAIGPSSGGMSPSGKAAQARIEQAKKADVPAAAAPAAPRASLGSGSAKPPQQQSINRFFSKIPSNNKPAEQPAEAAGSPAMAKPAAETAAQTVVIELD